MNRYLKDPIILLCVIAWVISFLVLAVKISSPPPKPVATATTPQAVPQPAPFVPNSNSPIQMKLAADLAKIQVLQNNLNNQNAGNPSAAAGIATNPSQATAPATNTAPNTAANTATNSAAGGSASGVIIPISRRTPGEIFVSKLAGADTDDLATALAQAKPNEVIRVDSGTYELADFHFTEVEHIRLVGNGNDTIIRLHSPLYLKGVTSLEKVNIEGPHGEESISVRDAGVLLLDNVTIRDSAVGVILTKTSKLDAIELKMEKIDSMCVSMRDTAIFKATTASFSDCVSGVYAAAINAVNVDYGTFKNNRFGFVVNDDRNQATCLHCTFDSSVQEKVNSPSRLILTDKTIPKTSEDKK